jgi:hypothetical protein
MNRFGRMAILAVFGLGITLMPSESFAAQNRTKVTKTAKPNKQFGSGIWLSPIGSQNWGKPSTPRTPEYNRGR